MIAMKIYQEEFDIETSKRTEVLDITDRVEEIVKTSKIKEGLCNVFASHATAAIILNENEAGLVKDMAEKIERDFPPGANYKHDRIDDNASSHLASAFIGQSRTIPINGNRLLRGTWQQIFFIELDGPRNSRRIVVTIIGE
jgi:secondary thiamine-phosphate synthase enzyme